MTSHDDSTSDSPDDDLRPALLAVGAFFAVGLLIGAGILIYALVSRGDGEPPGPPTAVIVDQLSLTFPNEGFSDEATTMLKAAGYEVDYVPGEQVTVDYYRTLPERDYELVLLRSHAGRYESGGVQTDDAPLFTSEPYDRNRHVDDQRAGRLTVSLFEDERFNDDTPYFSIPAEFVQSAMKGKFGGASVILMGCDVLRGERLAKAFVDRGAGVVVGWDAPVTAQHTDAATLEMLRLHLEEGVPLEDTTSRVMAGLGPDPFYDSSLRVYRADE